MFKDVNKTAVIEITLGVALAIILINTLAAAFSRTPVLGTMLGHNLEDGENAEDLENFGGRVRERMRERSHTRHEGRESVRGSRRKRKVKKIKDRYRKRASREDDPYYDNQQDEPLPDDDGGENSYPDDNADDDQ